MIAEKANLGDVEQLRPMAKAFFDASGYELIGEYSEGATMATLRGLTSAPDKVLLVVRDGDRVVGAAAAACVPVYFSDALMASELFWFVHPEWRRKGAGKALIQGLEEWAKKSGAAVLQMVALVKSDFRAVDSVYKRNGYTPTEAAYMKRLVD